MIYDVCVWTFFGHPAPQKQKKRYFRFFQRKRIKVKNSIRLVGIMCWFEGFVCVSGGGGEERG